MWEEDEIYSFLLRTYGSAKADPIAGKKTQAKLQAGGSLRAKKGVDARDQQAANKVVEVARPAAVMVESKVHGEGRASAPSASVVINGNAKQTAEPEDGLPVLMAFTSVTFAIFVVIILVGVLFLMKLGLCHCRCRRNAGA